MQENVQANRKQNGNLVRLGGISVLLALAIHLIVNGVVKQFPPENPSIVELKAYLSAEAGNWAVVHGLKYLALVGLILFAAGVYTRTCRNNGGVISGWGVVGLLGTALHVTNAMIANGIEVMAFYNFSRLSEEANLFWLLFYTVRVLFTAEIVAWGVVIFGFSMAGSQSATIPGWITALGFFCALTCLGSGIFVYSILNQGWAEILIDIASLTGLAWFASVGVLMLLRGDS